MNTQSALVHQSPDISVVTATLNASRTLPRCISAVAAQENVSVQHIVVDGGSEDGTRAILQAHESVGLEWLSEADNGVFDAWNKGLLRARGRWVCFLGADDFPANALAFHRLVSTGDATGTDICCGKVRLVHEASGKTLRIVGNPWNWVEMTRYQSVAHPSLIYRRKLFAEHGTFDAKLRVVGDYEFLLRLGSQVRAAYVDEVLVHMLAGGQSNTQQFAAIGESWQVQRRSKAIGLLGATRNLLVAALKIPARNLRNAIRTRQ